MYIDKIEFLVKTTDFCMNLCYIIWNIVEKVPLLRRRPEKHRATVLLKFQSTELIGAKKKLGQLIVL